jgi:hypothetical protein
MSEQAVACEVNRPTIPIWWLRFLQRVSSLKRGRVYNVIIIVPEQESKPVEWSFMGDGKRENEG